MRKLFKYYCLHIRHISILIKKSAKKGAHSYRNSLFYHNYFRKKTIRVFLSGKKNTSNDDCWFHFMKSGTFLTYLCNHESIRYAGTLQSCEAVLFQFATSCSDRSNCEHKIMFLVGWNIRTYQYNIASRVWWSERCHMKRVVN